MPASTNPTGSPLLVALAISVVLHAGLLAVEPGLDFPDPRAAADAGGTVELRLQLAAVAPPSAAVREATVAEPSPAPASAQPGPTPPAKLPETAPPLITAVAREPLPVSRPEPQPPPEPEPPKPEPPTREPDPTPAPDPKPVASRPVNPPPVAKPATPEPPPKAKPRPARPAAHQTEPGRVAALDRPSVAQKASGPSAGKAGDAVDQGVHDAATKALNGHAVAAAAAKPALLSAPVARYAPPPEYPEEARWEERTGATTLAFRIRPNGATRDIEVLASSGHADLDHAAVRALGRWRFKVDGAAPADARYRYRFRFRLD